MLLALFFVASCATDPQPDAANSANSNLPVEPTATGALIAEGSRGAASETKNNYVSDAEGQSSDDHDSTEEAAAGAASEDLPAQATQAPIVNRQMQDETTPAETGKVYLLEAGSEPDHPRDSWPGRSAALGIRNQHADKEGRDEAIRTTNVSALAQAWQIAVDDLVSHTPLIEDGRLFFADWGGKVYAADPGTGAILWKTDVVEPQRVWPWHGFAGTGTFGEGLLFEASVEGEAIALEPGTGAVVWRSRFVTQDNAGNLSDLLFHDGLVYIGVQSVSEGLDAGYADFEPTFRGNVVALDGKTGATVWRTYLVEPPQNGAAVWSSFALDPELNALYFTTSNNYTGTPSQTSDAIISLDAKTGAIRWVQQTTPGDVWTPAMPIGADYGYGAGAQLFEATIEGEPRRLVASGQKSGYFHAFDRDSGEHVWSAFIGFGQIGGGIRGEAAISGERIYIWSNNSYIGVNPPSEHPISVRALDAATGLNLWFHDKAQPAGGTAAGFLMNDVYFVGSLEGTIHGYDASTGEILWRTQVPGAVASSINVFNDSLYVGIGVPRIFGGEPNSRGVIAFRLVAP